jgi:hypothetical protein
MACSAASHGDAVCRKQRVNQNFTFAFLQAELAGIAEGLLAIVGLRASPLNPWHVSTMQQPSLAKCRIGAHDPIKGQQDILVRQIEQLSGKCPNLVRRIGTCSIPNCLSRETDYGPERRSPNSIHSPTIL